jgi:hypothetical protein
VDVVQHRFRCDLFSVFLSARNVLLPCTRNVPLDKSFFPTMPQHAGEAAYKLLITHNRKVVCDVPVRIVWVRHPLQRQPFLGIRTDSHLELWACLKTVEGQPVELALTPLESATACSLLTPTLLANEMIPVADSSTSNGFDAALAQLSPMMSDPIMLLSAIWNAAIV